MGGRAKISLYLNTNFIHQRSRYSAYTLTGRVRQLCITVENSPNPSRVYIRLCKHRKKVFYCFYKIFLKDNSTNEGKCWFFHFLIETDFLDTRSYFLPTNQNARLTIHNQSKFVRIMSQPCLHTLM